MLRILVASASALSIALLASTIVAVTWYDPPCFVVNEHGFASQIAW